MGMSHRGRFALYAGFLALIGVTILVAPFFSSALGRMSLLPYSAFCGAATFVLVTLYQGIAAKFGVAPFRPAKWILCLFRVPDETPTRP
jgi:hypothetical protein